jgi:hypothetical protein
MRCEEELQYFDELQTICQHAALRPGVPKELAPLARDFLIQMDPAYDNERLDAVLNGQDKNDKLTPWRLHTLVMDEDLIVKLKEKLKKVRAEGFWWPAMQLNRSQIAESAKVNALLQILSKEGVGEADKKALVYSQKKWPQMLDIVKSVLQDKYGISCVVLPDSPMNDKQKRREALNLFRSDEKYSVLLMPSNPTAEGFEELSIPEATVIVHLDVDLNVQRARRAEDRAHCIMQTKPVAVYHVLCKDTVEHALYKKWPYLVDGDKGEDDNQESGCCAILRAEMNRLVAGPCKEEPVELKNSDLFGDHDESYIIWRDGRKRDTLALTDRSQAPSLPH